MLLDWLIPILLAVGGALQWFAVGLAERDAKWRAVCLLATVPIATASVLIFARLYLSLPFWLALPAGVAVLAGGVVCVYFIVARAVPRKLRLQR